MIRFSRAVLILLFALQSIPAQAQDAEPEIVHRSTSKGIEYGLWRAGATADVTEPAPTLFVLASNIDSTLSSPYFRQAGEDLAKRGYLLVSIDLPCHGARVDAENPAGLSGWRTLAKRGEDFVAENNARLSAVLDELIKSGLTDPEQVAVCGTSRGGFLAIHFAAEDARVACAAGFAPVTDLAALSEFKGLESDEFVKSLGLESRADRLAGRPIWIVIGDVDERVGTDKAVGLGEAIRAASEAKGIETRAEVHVKPEPRGHTTPAGAADEAAGWIHQQLLASAAAEPVRVGVLGFDSYQAIAFTQLFHKPPTDNHDIRGLKVVAAWPGGSPDIEKTIEDIERWRPRFVDQGVPIVDTVEAVLEQSDAIIIMSVDGRAHLDAAASALRAKKPVYIGRPMAASLEDVIEIFQIAEENETPLFSCSQHRFSPGFIGMRNHPEVGIVRGCDVFGGVETEPHHPEFFWHSIHSFETLYTIMGAGAESVSRASTTEAELVTGVWADGRIGTYRGIKTGAVAYSALVFGDEGVARAGKYGYAAPVNGVVPKGRYKGYEGVATEIAKFFKTQQLPIEPSETIELWAFMEAAHESKRRGGVPVKIEEVLEAARKRVAERTKPR